MQKQGTEVKQKSHWQSIYTSKKLKELSWHQDQAKKSLELVKKTKLGKQATVIDVGGGVSVFVDDLLKQDYKNITVLDISAEALQQSKARLGETYTQVNWIEGDITSVELPSSKFDIWHDRAVFHFLTSATERALYLKQLQNALKPDGFVIIATFNLNGPQKCSGLEVIRYDSGSLSKELGVNFTLLDSFTDVHQTPWESTQNFQYCLFSKKL